MIKGTKSNCTIKDVKVSKSTAYITLIVTSSELNNPSIPFQIGIRDYNLDNLSNSRQLVLLDSLRKSDLGYHYCISNDATIISKDTMVSNTIYWLDTIHNYSDDSYNININMYREIILEVDITNNNKSSIIDNKFVRQIHIYFKNVETGKIIWNSETIVLISSLIELPSIKNLSIKTDKNYNISCSFKYNYEHDSDYNYNNKHLFTTINVISPQNNTLLESLLIEDEDYKTSTVKFTLTKQYTETIIIKIILKNYYGSDKIVDYWINSEEYKEKLVGGTAMKTYKYYYTPRVQYSNMFIKVNNTINRVTNIYCINKDSQNE